MNEQLKPCPFCGKQASIENAHIVCGCKSTWKVKDGDIQGAVKEWNSRPIEDQLYIVISELEKQLEETKKQYQFRITQPVMIIRMWQDGAIDAKTITREALK